jgi:hypothetical protein
MDLETLEKELRSLRPSAPSESLIRRVAETTGGQPEASVVFFPEAASLRRRIRRWQAGAATAGAMAACLALVLFVNNRPSPETATPAPVLAGKPLNAVPAGVAASPALAAVPDAKARVKEAAPAAVHPAAQLVMLGREGRLQSAQQEGWLDQQDGTRTRLVRLRYLDSVRWQDPSDHGAIIETTLPREQIVRVPEEETY